MTDTHDMDDFDDLAYDDELESLLQQAETASASLPIPIPPEIEDSYVSPFEQFRKKGWLSVSDLVGTVWCEVQYDYRLRTLPYLPPSERPAVIRSDKGKEIPVDKVKVEGKDRILKRGEKIHKRLEREIHPQEVIITATTREDVWGLRFLNMLSAVEALLTLGKCRELPVVGFVGDMLVMGIIDEVTRVPLSKSTPTPSTRSSRQTALTSFFSSTASSSTTRTLVQTHELYVSDSKTRASGSLPKESDTLAGQLQCMVYKQLLDSLLLAPFSSDDNFTFSHLFAHLDLDPSAAFSDSFLAQAKPVVLGNALRCGTSDARCLQDMVQVWTTYVELLGLGTPGKGQTGSTEKRLELVYRRAAPRKEKGTRGSKRRKGRRKGGNGDAEHGETLADFGFAGTTTLEADQGERDLARAIELSLKDMSCDQAAFDPAGVKNEGGDGDSGDDSDYLTPPSSLPPSSQPPPKVSIDEAFDVADRPGGSLSAPLQQTVAPPTPSHNPVNSKRGPPNGLLADHRDGPLLHAQSTSYTLDRTSDDEREEEELAWAVEMSLMPMDDDLSPIVSVPLSQPSQPSDGSGTAEPLTEETSPNVNGNSRSPSPSPVDNDTGTSGSIIGRHRFQYNSTLLQAHLDSVLQYWRGAREPVGVQEENAQRCGWCEFEEGCEWREEMAKRAWARVKRKKAGLGIGVE